MTTTDDEMRAEYAVDADDVPAALDEWDTWLTAHDARIRCEAYDEGYEDGQHDAHEHRPWRKSTHPYRQEQTQ